MYGAVLGIIQEIKEAKGHAKHPLIVKYINENVLFAKVVEYTLNTSRTFKIKKVKWTVDADPSLDLFAFLDYLNDKRGATKEDRAGLAACASGSDQKFQVVNIILDRKLGCGCTVKTMRDLMPGFVPYFPYMRCSGLDQLKKIVFPCFSQLKADGEYFDVFLQRAINSSPKFQTRNGKIADFSLVPNILPRIFPTTDIKFSGEALLLKKDGSGYEDRKDGNAIINKALYGLLSQEEANRIRFSFWDVDVENRGPLHYRDRWETIQQLNVTTIECRIVNNMEEAWAHYDEVRARGLEGTILKNFDAPWKDGTSMNQIKLKAEKECELEVYDVVPGKDKYHGMVGSLCCKSSCGQLLTDVGMGLSDADRAMDDWPGQIITVKFNAVTKSKVKETWAMSHARLVDARPDKSEADDLAYIKKVKEVKRK